MNATRRFLPLLVCACALGLATPAALAAVASAPSVSTSGATAIASTSVTLNGTVNPKGQATTYYFQYGTTTAYGSQTPAVDAGSGTANVKASAAVGSLAPATTYHYRLVGNNASGTTPGADHSFKTTKTTKATGPVVTTGKPKSVGDTAATLTGTIDPSGQATSYYFQYGRTTAYGGQTPTASAGAGSAAVAVSAAIGSLTPGATYHYRLVASTASGTTPGADATFKTPLAPTPPGSVSIAASPSTVTLGQVTTLSGTVLSPRPLHTTVTLQTAPEALGPWVNSATTAVSTTGAYSFPVTATANTYYRALASDGAASAPVHVLVGFRVGLLVSRLHPLLGTLVRFHGRVAPGHRGLRVLIQRLGPHGKWLTVARTRLRGRSRHLSSYSVRVPIERSGRYRVVVVRDGRNTKGHSRGVRIRVH